VARPRGKSVIKIYDAYAEIQCKHCNFIIDLDDVDLVAEYRWFSKLDGRGIPYCYSHYTGDKKIMLHRFIMGLVPDDGKICDHINRDTKDNRKANLRICSRAENNRNAKKNVRGVTSKYKGVTRRPSGRFGVYINFNKKAMCLGTYDTEQEAAMVYNKSALQLYGEYANLNVIEGENYE
jgi:transcription initiation factor TFIIIB Brf1 subunit/transcription initiation factor TFIIB